MKGWNSFSASSLCSSSWQLLSNHPQRSFVIYTNLNSAIIDISAHAAVLRPIHATSRLVCILLLGHFLPCIIESCIQICVFFVFHLYYCFWLIFLIWWRQSDTRWLIAVFYWFSILPIAWIFLMLDLQIHLSRSCSWSAFIAHLLLIIQYSIIASHHAVFIARFSPLFD